MAIPKLYRPGEAAATMNISRRQVIRFMDAGKLGHIQLGGRGKRGVRLIPEAAIVEFLNRNARGCRIAAILDPEPSEPAKVRISDTRRS